jgi:hypothetical protein
MSNYDELYQQARRLGFTFEHQEWIPDDIDKQGRELTAKDKEGAIKVIYPKDYPHPSGWVYDRDSKQERSNSLSYCIKEYLFRNEIAKQTVEHNKNVTAGMEQLEGMLRSKTK